MKQTSSPKTSTHPAPVKSAPPAIAALRVRTDVRAGECVRQGDVTVCR